MSFEIAPFLLSKTQKTSRKDSPNAVEYSCEQNITTTRLYQKRRKHSIDSVNSDGVPHTSHRFRETAKQLLEELDYSKLYEAYSRTGRNPAVAPKNLFKVLVYGYMNNIYTSRALERACRRDVNFMWLLEGQAAPDHNTIARFRSKRLEGMVQDLFNQMVLKLHELNEIAFENIFIDGTTLRPAPISTASSGRSQQTRTKRSCRQR